MLSSLDKWGEMMLAIKAGRGEGSLSAAEEIGRVRETYLGDARAILQKISRTDSVMARRGLIDKLLHDGLVFGAKHDTDTERKACSRRADVRALTAVHQRLQPPPIAGTSVRLRLAAAPLADPAFPTEI